MANKGLKSLSESLPNFSNQALENAINDLKIGWVAKSIQLDTDIENNIILTASQKNDLKDTINNIGYLNAGGFLGDLLRHTNTIIDGSILPIDNTVANPTVGTFLEILQLVQSVQSLVPDLLGVTAEEKSRGVNDHLGTLNNIFIATEDSSQPTFTSIRDSIIFITNASLATEALLETAIDNLSAFLNEVVGDSTDFQQTLDGFATAVATANTNFDTALQAQPYAIKRSQLILDRDSINSQVSLENSNLTDIRTYTETLADNISFTSLAEDEKLRKLMANVAQDSNWISYFNNFEEDQFNLNPIYNTDADSSKEGIINAVLVSRGLPDVVDFNDVEAVANKAIRDDRIDTAGFSSLTPGEIIRRSLTQLSLDTFGNLLNQSERLLNNLNKRDRDIVRQQLDLNQETDTLS